MKVGIYAGGFKPLTMGHFSMLALAAKENDKVFLLYGMKGRKKGSDFNYTDEMAQEIFDLNKEAIESHPRLKNVFVIEGRPSPIAIATGAILSKLENKVEPASLFDMYGIDPSTIILTIYVGPDDIQIYQKYMNKDPNIRFDMGPAETAGISRMEQAVKDIVGDESFSPRTSTRGSELRAALMTNQELEHFKKFVPPIYSNEQLEELFNIMKKGISPKVNEQILRKLVRTIIMERK